MRFGVDLISTLVLVICVEGRDKQNVHYLYDGLKNDKGVYSLDMGLIQDELIYFTTVDAHGQALACFKYRDENASGWKNATAHKHLVNCQECLELIHA